MLITKLKDHIPSLPGRVFVINCHGCKEVSFPEQEALSYQAGLDMTGCMTTDYICQPDNLALRLQRHADAIASADAILVFSCGVGVQTVASLLPDKRVYAACDTYALPGFQGVTPLEHDCGQCGQCYLNITGGICPITACSKSLLNGQCGGAKDGMCEVDPTMECGWERIYRRLHQIGRADLLKCPIQLRDHSVDDK